MLVLIYTKFVGTYIDLVLEKFYVLLQKRGRSLGGSFK